MKLSTLLAPLIAAKVPHDVILQTVIAFEAEHGEAVEAGKEKARARWRKWKAANAGKRLPTVANDSKRLASGDAGGSDKTSNLEIEPQEQKETPQAALETVLSPELAHEVVAHRKAMKKALTPYGAKLLAKQIAACPDPAAAAEAMIANGWQGVKPSYMVDRQQPRGSPPQRPQSKADAITELRESLRNGQLTDRRDAGPDGDHGVVLSLTGRAG